MGSDPARPTGTERVPVVVRGNLESKPTSGYVEIVTWTAAERRGRAFRALAGAWGIGLFCVIIPILHFVLVPGLFLAGLALAIHFAKQASVSRGGEGTCSDCGKEFRIEKSANRFPLQELCENCRSTLSIERAKPADAV